MGYVQKLKVTMGMLDSRGVCLDLDLAEQYQDEHHDQN